MDKDLRKMNRAPLLNEPYVNEVTLTEQNLLQSYKLAKLEDDLVIWESNPGRTHVVRGGPHGRIFFRSPTLTSCSFAAL